MNTIPIFNTIHRFGDSFDFSVIREEKDAPEFDKVQYRETFLEAWEVGQLLGGN